VYISKRGRKDSQNRGIGFDMNTVVLIFQIALLVIGVFLVGAVLMQQGKAHGLSGAIAGGAETFFGKEKGKDMNKKLSVATTVVGIVFVLAVLVLYIMEPEVRFSTVHSNDNWVYSPYQQMEVSQLQKVEENKTENAN
jgi:preprotein translocase subunit SecG